MHVSTGGATFGAGWEARIGEIEEAGEGVAAGDGIGG